MFLSDLLVVGDSALWAELSIDDYAKQTAELVPGRQSMNGKQSGDAAELAHAVVELIDWPTSPQRFVAGTDGVDSVAQKGHASWTRSRRTGGCPPASKRSISPSWASIDRVPRREHLSHIT
jgi:hypothetical protein